MDYFAVTLGMLPLFGQIDVFLLIVVRLLGFFVVLPILSGANIPNLSKIILATGIAVIIFTTGIVDEVHYSPNVPGYIGLIAEEFFVGFLMGFVTYLAFTVFHFAGHMMDFHMGFKMVNVMDPLTQIQVPLVGNILYLIVCVVFIVTGGLHTFIYAINVSYTFFQPGQAFVLGNDRLYFYILSLFSNYIQLGFRIALPVIGTILVVDASLGILVKAVPQMNVFSVGLPLKVLIGTILLFILLPVFVGMANPVFDLATRALYNVMGGLAP